MLSPDKRRARIIDMQNQVLKDSARVRYVECELQTPEILAYRRVLLMSEHGILEERMMVADKDS
jgi:hypothetical protein